MSTVGKVLCVAIALPTLAWIWLAANVAQWNRLNGKVLNTVRENIASTDDELVKTKSDIGRTRANVALVQKEKELRLTSARSLISQLYRENSSSKETLERFTLQFDATQAAEKTAEARKAQTRELLVRTEREVASSRADLAQVKDENTTDRATLEQLRNDLRTTLTQNQQLVQARLKGAAPAANPAARNAPALTAPVTR
jgi:hypothetical protein